MSGQRVIGLVQTVMVQSHRQFRVTCQLLRFDKLLRLLVHPTRQASACAMQHLAQRPLFHAEFFRQQILNGCDFRIYVLHFGHVAF